MAKKIKVLQIENIDCNYEDAPNSLETIIIYPYSKFSKKIEYKKFPRSVKSIIIDNMLITPMTN